MSKYNISFTSLEDDIRLSEEIKKHVSRKIYKKIKSTNALIYVNGVLTKTFLPIKKGDSILIEIEEIKETNWDLYEARVDVYYEDDNYLVVNKRAGLLSIPTMGEPYSLYQEVLYYLHSKGSDDSVSILNRLDKDTSGLCVIAKNRRAASLVFPTHEKMVRKYYALLEGILPIKEGKIVNFIAKDENSNKRFVNDAGKLAISNYQVVKEINGNSLVEFVLETGRTHQIRVHSSYLGHPIIGDRMYGNCTDDRKLMLLSHYVEFYNQIEQKEVKVEMGVDWFEEGIN